MTVRIHLVLAIFLTLLLPGISWGLEAFTRPLGQSAHLEMGNFQIYPINHFGNALYLKQTLLKHFPEQSVRAALNIRDDRGVLALVEEQDGMLKLELIRTADDQEGRLRKGRGEFYEFADYKAGVQQVFDCGLVALYLIRLQLVSCCAEAGSSQQVGHQLDVLVIHWCSLGTGQTPP